MSLPRLLPLAKPSSASAALSLDPDPDPPPKKSPSSSDFLWSSLFSEPSASISPSSASSYLPNGTPVVLAPPSVILKASLTWAGHLLCRFLGEPPSPAKFYNDLNRIWGKHGDISVRRFSSGTFLVFVPSAGTRKWILQTGLWSSDTVSFVVSEWSVNASLAAPPKLTLATTVLTIREIPPQLWSQEAVATIAGAVAKLIPDTRAFLSRSSLGTATIRAIVPLGSSLPPSVLVKDSNGDSVLVTVEYGNLPHLCPNCNSYGHKSHRCPVKTASVALNAQPSSSQVDKSITEVPPPCSNISSPIPEMMKSQDTSILERPSTMIPPVSGIAMDVDNVVGSLATEAEFPELQNNKTATSDEVLPNVIEDQSPSSNNASPVLSLSHSLDLNIPKSTDPKDPSVGDIEMEVAGSSFIISENLKPKLLASPVHPLPQDSIESIMSEVVPELQTSNVPSSEIQSHQALISNIPLIPVMPCESSATQEDNSHQTTSEADQTKFTFPPPLSCVISPVTDPLARPESPSVCSPSQPQIGSQKSVKRGGTKDNRQSKFDPKASLRCTAVSHQFKPKGITEKRRKKLSNDLIPSDEDVQECILEMQSDMVNTLHFEAIDAYKVLRKIEA